MPLGFRAILLVLVLLALWPVPLGVQTKGIPADQQEAVKAIVEHIRVFEGEAKADAVLKGFNSHSIVIGPVPDNDNADTNPDTHVITLNPKLLAEIHRPDGKQSFRATADWAATLQHEQVHAGQATSMIMASNTSRVAGKGCPHEVEGWKAGFQSYYNWIDSLRHKLGSGSEADREAVALKLRDLIKGFNEYRQNYPHNFGAMRINGWDQVPTDLDDAAKEVQQLEKAVNAALEEYDFVVTTKPFVQTAKKGESFTVSANPRGGAFDTPSATNRASLYTYAWYADGVPLGLTGPSITRKATKSESITVQVTDRLARKRRGTCKVTVDENVVSALGWKVVWGSLSNGWTVSNGGLKVDRSNLIAGAGERKLVDNPQFVDTVHFRWAATPLPGYDVRAIVEVAAAREQDFSTPEKIAARFTDSRGRATPGYQGTKECQFQGHRALRYEVGFPQSTVKEWGYFVELDPARNLWSAVMCHVEARYSGPRDAGPSKDEQVSKKLELEQTAERLLQSNIRIQSN